ncbi:hypothetical protein CWC28_22255, partial [Pseudoalteromonas sp. S4492]|uniref:hypothetical protein n=1 Tax=Pseudoalteromonas sp. S4492 TaxID=579560 RepID=UPI00126F62EF
MMYKDNIDLYQELIPEFRTAVTAESFTEADAEKLSMKSNIWHEDLPQGSKKMLSQCFIRDDSTRRKIVE